MVDVKDVSVCVDVAPVVFALRLLAVERLVDGARTVIGHQGLDLLGARDRRVARQRKRARHGVHQGAQRGRQIGVLRAATGEKTIYA